jgi:hypothetical protein
MLEAICEITSALEPWGRLMDTFDVLMTYGTVLPQNKQLVCRYFTIVEHLGVVSRETIPKC